MKTAFPLAILFTLSSTWLSPVACGGAAWSEGDAGSGGNAGSTGDPQGGSAGSGSGGGSAGSAGNAGAAGHSGTAGSAGSDAGSGGDAGSGSSDAGSGGDGGTGGDAGSGGSDAGSGGSDAGSGGDGGAGGDAGSGPEALSCTTVNDCVGLIPSTLPANCATALCDTDSHTCRLVARDFDGDGFRTTLCQSLDAGRTIELGDDCNDADPNVHPGAWDGPSGLRNGAVMPDRCNGSDNNCNGQVNDSATDDNKTCSCTPQDSIPCAEEPNGSVIIFPLGQPTGACKMGKRTCTASGTWGACIGAQGPVLELCNAIDDDCDGEVDELADVGDAHLYFCDHDGDGHVTEAAVGVLSCSPGPASQCDGQWVKKSGKVDCNDNDPSIYAGAPELCDGKDNDCDGAVDNHMKVGTATLDRGAACNVNDKPVGACAGTGTVVCSGTAAICQSPNPEIGKPNLHATPAPNGSFDWDCNGVVDVHSATSVDSPLCGDAEKPGQCKGSWQGAALAPLVCGAFVPFRTYSCSWDSTLQSCRDKEDAAKSFVITCQ